MSSFDVVSEVDAQEVRNAVDQASRELTTRFDFKGTNSTIELKELEIEMHSSSEDRLTALRQVLEEKLVKRKVSLKSLEYLKVEDAAGGTVRQTAKINAGISSEKAQGRQQGASRSWGSRASSPRPRAIRCASPARSATTSRR